MTIAMALRGNHGGSGMWPSLATAERVADIANVFFIGSLVVGVVATVTIVWMTNVKERYWDQDRQASAERIVTLTTQGDRLRKDTEDARAELGKANADIARANARAAALENDAAQARLEQERLKAQLAWRTLSPEQTVSLQARLAQKPNQVNIQYPAGDTEAEYLAIQFANLFGKAGWQVAMLSATIHGSVVWGIFIPDPAYDATPTIREAFTAAGISFSTGALPPAGMGFGNSLPNAPTLFIGSKPIPNPP
jgi:hypothetical protein